MHFNYCQQLEYKKYQQIDEYISTWWLSFWQKKYIKTFKLMTYRFPSRQNHETDLVPSLSITENMTVTIFSLPCYKYAQVSFRIIVLWTSCAYSSTFIQRHRIMDKCAVFVGEYLWISFSWGDIDDRCQVYGNRKVDEIVRSYLCAVKTSLPRLWVWYKREIFLYFYKIFTYSHIVTLVF